MIYLLIKKINIIRIGHVPNKIERKQIEILLEVALNDNNNIFIDCLHCMNIKICTLY